MMIRGLFKKTSWAFILLLTLSMVNLMMMHFLQQKGGVLEEPLVRTSWVNCLISCMLDVTLLFAFSMADDRTWAVSENIIYGDYFSTIQ